MVMGVRQGESIRSVARRFGVALSTVQFWRQRAGDQRLERVDWSDRPCGPRNAPHRVAPQTEDLILSTRQVLKKTSDLGEYGAQAIRRQLIESGLAPVPSVRTIGRVLERRGALDARRRQRHRPPPVGWYLPLVRAGQAEVDSFDVVDGLVIKNGPQVEVLNAISILGGLCESWPLAGISARSAHDLILEHWRAFGLPRYAQFDNDTRFQGAHQWADSFGRVTRLCLSLGVTPVFTVPRETGFQAAIESYNGRWQAKVWARFEHGDLGQLQVRSARYVQAARLRGAERIARAPQRPAIAPDWIENLQAPLAGLVIYLRRTDQKGCVSLLGHTFEVPEHWTHRLVRCEVDLTQECIRFYSLRRRDPSDQPLLLTVPYKVPRVRFHE